MDDCKPLPMISEETDNCETDKSSRLLFGDCLSILRDNRIQVNNMGCDAR